MSHGIYRVTGKREYRGHKPGETFVARLDPNAEYRAITRGDIELVERVTPKVDASRLTFPKGWLE